MVIYADVVFLINFFGDMLCLWVLSEIDGKIPMLRRLLAASFGGIYALLCTVPELEFLGSAAGAVLSAGVMVMICCLPASPKRIVRSTALFFMSSMLLAGGAELVGAKGLLKVMLTLFGTVCLVICALLTVRSKIYAKYLPCKLALEGTKVSVLGFYDSGNRLFEGEDERIVIVGDDRLLKKLVAKEAAWNNLDEWLSPDKIVTVPFQGAASGAMRGVVLDYVKVSGRRYDNVVLAVSETELADNLVLNSIMI